MPTKKPIRSNVRTSARAGSKVGKSKRLKITLAIVGLIVALVGGFLVYQSFASSGLGNAGRARQGNSGLGNAGRATQCPTGQYPTSVGCARRGGPLPRAGDSAYVLRPTPQGKLLPEPTPPAVQPRSCPYGRYNNGGCKPRPTTNNRRATGRNAQRIRAARPAPPPPPKCKWNNSILASDANCQPPWPREFGTDKYNQWSPLPMYLAYPRVGTTTTTAVDLSTLPIGMNNWNLGPNYDKPGNIKGSVAFNNMKAQRYWYGNNTAGPSGQPRPYAKVLICARANGGGTVAINVRNSEQKDVTIASFNVDNRERIFCGTYPQSKIINFSVVAQSRLGRTVRIEDVSMRLLLR